MQSWLIEKPIALASMAQNVLAFNVPIWHILEMQLCEYLAKFEKKPDQFAADIGVDRTTVLRYLRGKRKPTLEIVGRIQRATDGKVSLGDFYKVPPEAA
jgi:transcriptional regulator with XRE-family HTH domain